MLDEDILWHIIILMPQLKFLDFCMITEKNLEEAFKKFPWLSQNNKAFAPNQKYFHESPNLSFLNQKKHPDKEAYVERLANGRGFDILLANDTNFSLLYSFPLASSTVDEYQLRITAAFDEWHRLGHKYHEQKLEEKKELMKAVEEAKCFALNIAREEETKFIVMKEEIPKELCIIYQKRISDDEKDKKVEELRKKCEAELRCTARNLIHSTCMCTDLLLNVSEIFKHEIVKINTKYVQEVEHCYGKIMDSYNKCVQKLKEFYQAIFDCRLNYESVQEYQEIKLDFGLKQLLKKRELVEMTLQMSIKIQSALLQERIKNLKAMIESDMLNILDEVTESIAFGNQDSQMRSIVVFCNKQKMFINKLFTKNSIFKYHLGYR